MSARVRERTRLVGRGTCAALLATLALPVGAFAETARFGFTGAEQEFVVPAGVTSITVTATGAAGTRRPFGVFTGSPGRPAQVTGALAVTPGQRLFVEVGEEPAGFAAAFNGGGAGAGGYSGAFSGAGGGASDVRTISRGAPGTLTSRLIVAGGSGGAGRNFMGGDAGTTGAAADGGGPSCQGRGATLDAPGAGGPGDLLVLDGLAGALGQGGIGGPGNTSTYPGAGGGGGGGLFGGGGGGANGSTGCGGGGGSSLVPPGGTAVLVANTTTVVLGPGDVPVLTRNAVAPAVDISYALPAAAGGGGTSPSGQAAPATPTTARARPVLSRLTVAPAAFIAANTGPAAVAAAVGGRVSFRLAGDAATVTFTVERVVRGHRRRGRCVARAPSCRRYVRVRGSIVREAAIGANAFRFMGRLGSRALARGSYRLVAVARTGAGLTSAPVRASFRIR